MSKSTGRGRRFNSETSELQRVQAHSKRNADSLIRAELIKRIELEAEQESEKFDLLQRQVRELEELLRQQKIEADQKAREQQGQIAILQERLTAEQEAREQEARDRQILKNNTKKLKNITSTTAINAFVNKTLIPAPAESSGKNQKRQKKQQEQLDQLDQLNGLLDDTPEKFQDEFRLNAEVILYKKIARDARTARKKAEERADKAEREKGEALAAAGTAREAQTKAEGEKGEAQARADKAERDRAEALAAAETARVTKEEAETQRNEALAAAETARDALAVAETQRNEAIAEAKRERAAKAEAEREKDEAMTRAAREAKVAAEGSSQYNEILSSALMEIRTSGLRGIELDNISVLESESQDSKVINSASGGDIESLSLSQKLQALKTLSVEKTHLPKFQENTLPKLQSAEQAYEKTLQNRESLVDKLVNKELVNKEKLSKAFNAWRSQTKIEKLSKTLEKISGIINPQSSNREQEDVQEHRETEFSNMTHSDQKNFIKEALSTVQTLKNSIDRNTNNDSVIDITQEAMLKFLSLKNTITLYYNKYAEQNGKSVVTSASSMSSFKNDTEKQEDLAAALSASPDFRSSLAEALKDISIYTKAYVKIIQQEARPDNSVKDANIDMDSKREAERQQ